ncbi:hypothetical protein ACFFSH_38355 [Streptomyces filamentosus]|uniref:DUF4352 domain-containing protein n=1 Tax=Streptomyces filamentosus TaxID=67294 RepID=A0A919B9N0_STRFL|nr:hypothetical protein [Streptomyces filamentosus]GHF76975.1 hypothetical protein GCM10017667_00280 [Streptomyces filamentosus]
MRIRPIAAMASLAFALTLTACGAADNPPATPSDKQGAEASTATAAPAAETTSQPPAATTEPSTSGPLALGTTHTWEDTENGIRGTSAVLSYQQGIKSVGSAAEHSGTPGYVWAALELKVCSVKGLFAATTTPWTLSYADGARVEPSSGTWADFPKPQFPIETKLTPGKCVRGKVVYPVPGNSRPQTVVYAPDGFDVPVEWAVPTK